MYLSELPPEIYDGILTHVPRGERQQTTLSLTRAIPRSPVPLHHLFECIRLKSAESTVQLHRRLRGCTEEPYWVQDFSLETWNADADVVVNLVALFSRLSRISLFVGPNFSPEHMEEILEMPRATLSCITLRFRPYVQRATYYQFLKGAYFDTALETLARWPTATLATLSIIQDPLDADIARRYRFAQPLVFFSLDPINTLACSPCLRSLTKMRLRIPSKQVAPFINRSSCVPGVRILDLSTSSIRLNDVEVLVARFRQLAHLIVDGCHTWDDARITDWVNVGQVCALATVKAAREREKKLRSWLEAHTVPNPEMAPEEAATRRARPGRRGLAAATISLRGAPARTTVIGTSTVVAKVRIVPSPPTLCSLSTTISALHEEKQDAIRAQFNRGWHKGISQLCAIRSRLYQSWRNGTRVVRMTGHGSEDGFEGLEDVDGEGAFCGLDGWPTPVLCLAGECGRHVDGCGHAAAADI